MNNWEQKILASTVKEWQNIIDLLVKILGVKMGLITRVIAQEIEVFVVSNTPNNPYNIGDRQPWLNSGLYCEYVIKTQEKLLVKNALNSAQWCNNPLLKDNLISYLGFPLRLNNGQIFGTICLLHDQEWEYTPEFIALMEKMRDLIESHLTLQENNFSCENCQLLIDKSNEEIKELKQQLETEIIQRNIELEELNQRLTLALKAGAIGCWEWDIENNTIIWDERMYEMYGVNASTQKSNIFKTWKKILYQKDCSETLESLQEIISDEQQKIFNLEFRIQRFDGQIRYIKANGFVIRNQNGEALKMIGLNTDITESKQKEEQLTNLNEQLLQSLRLKDNFLSTMSHELRTPLTAILGMAECLQDDIYGEVNERQLKAIKIIETKGLKLLELISDILDFSKIQSGELKLNCQETNIFPLCQSIIETIKPQVEKKEMQISMNIPPNLPPLFIDPKYMRQVLIHVLNNAIKFTPFGGSITLEVTTHKKIIPVEPPPLQGITKVRIYRTPWEKKFGQTIDEEHLVVKHYLRFSVQDTGIGIATNKIAYLFAPFSQHESALNRQYEGIGIGLPFVKHIVELHGGEVNMSSQFGVGSCLTIDLPIEPPMEGIFVSENLVSVAKNAVKTPLILLVENHKAHVMAMENYLEVKGYNLIVAENEEEALNCVKEQNPDLILIDISNPKIKGITIIENLKKDSEFNSIPIIALTDLTKQEYEKHSPKMQADQYLIKPIKIKELIKQIQELLTR